MNPLKLAFLAGKRFVSTMHSDSIGRATRWLVTNTGGRCAYVHELWVCEQGRLPLKSRGGATYGTTFVTDVAPWKVGRDLAAHEKYHRDQQWNQDGLLFPGLYYRAEVIDVWIGGGCNRYEAAAEAASNGGGGYTC